MNDAIKFAVNSAENAGAGGGAAEKLTASSLHRNSQFVFCLIPRGTRIINGNIGIKQTERGARMFTDDSKIILARGVNRFRKPRQNANSRRFQPPIRKETE